MMSKLNKAGEIEVEFVIPFENPVLAFGAARGADGVMHVAAMKNLSGGVFALSVTRSTASNVPDPAYGSNGFAEVTFEEEEYDGVRNGAYGISLVVQGDGVIVVGRNMALNPVAAMARFDGQGKLDQTFGNAGKAVHHFPHRPSSSKDRVIESPGHKQESESWRSQGTGRTGCVTLQTSERLLFFGHNPYDDNGFLAKFKLNGRIDPEFGNEGVVRMLPPGPGARCLLYGATEFSDGNIVAYGGAYYSKPPAKGFMARFLSTGQPDESFADMGYLLIDGPEEFPAASFNRLTFRGVVEGEDSSLVCSAELRIVPTSGSYSDYGLVARFDKNGSPSQGFNNGKAVVFGLLGRNNGFWTVASQDDGKLVAGGYSEVLGVSPTQVEYVVARFNADGGRDVTFGGKGFVNGTFGDGINFLDLLFIDRGFITMIAKHHEGIQNPINNRQHYVAFNM